MFAFRSTGRPSISLSACVWMMCGDNGQRIGSEGNGGVCERYEKALLYVICRNKRKHFKGHQMQRNGG